MLELKGRYGKDCKVFIDTVDDCSLSTIYGILNQAATENVPVRIMPDVHDGQDIVVGFTMPLTNGMVNPQHVGVDINCGLLSVPMPYIGKKDLSEIDKAIRKSVPMGFTHRSEPLIVDEPRIEKLAKKIGLDYRSVVCQLGTLGGGNHFIEIGQSDSKPDNCMLFIHTGSRNFGLKVCKYHVNKAKRNNCAAGYLTGELLEDYMHDMNVAAYFAKKNRELIAEQIFKALNLPIKSLKNSFETVHNYISSDDNMIRKGAIAAYKDQIVAIPMNMRDGVLICKGKGNVDWNCSAPHGAGRILSRSQAKEYIKLEDFEKSMEGIYSSSVSKGTIDESPMVYKDTDVIKSLIGDTVEILETMKPLLNIKATSTENE
jgi:RNA-splicing ligase RtcB